MRIFLGLCGVACFLLSLGTCAQAKGAPHEIEGLIFLVAGTIFLTAGAIIEVITRPSRDQARELKRGTLGHCGACRGVIPANAVKCQHCGSTLTKPFDATEQTPVLAARK